jgi:hypothetical protein
MTITLGETYTTASANPSGAKMAAQNADRRSPRRARRELATRLAHSGSGHRVAAAMIGVLAVVALAGAWLQVAAG